MASSTPCQSPKHQNCVADNSMYSATGRGSKAQLCLRKILSIISTVRPPQISSSEPPLFSSESKESSSQSQVISAGGRDQCDEEGEKSDEHDRRKHGEAVEINSVEIAQLNINKNNNEADRSFSLLIEAAKLILGEFKEHENSETEKQMCELKKEKSRENELNEERKRQESRCSLAAAAEAETGGGFDAPPVLRRSKRRRNQILPHRYRDSVLEPLTRLSGHGSAHLVPTKRRKR